jgi:SAM-dependent methyltransferase
MIYYRQYDKYSDYTDQQGKKAHVISEALLSKRAMHRRQKRFGKLFRSLKQHMMKGSVLCLGARTGCEIRGAQEAGFGYCTGIDIHPLSDMVIRADWHELPFRGGVFNNVFTNSLDHCYDFPKLVFEVARVLVQKGSFVIETYTGYALSKWEGGHHSPDEIIDRHVYNSMFWDDINDLTEVLEHGELMLSYKAIQKKNCWFVFRKKQK